MVQLRCNFTTACVSNLTILVINHTGIMTNLLTLIWDYSSAVCTITTIPSSYSYYMYKESCSQVIRALKWCNSWLVYEMLIKGNMVGIMASIDITMVGGRSTWPDYILGMLLILINNCPWEDRFWLCKISTSYYYFS